MTDRPPMLFALETGNPFGAAVASALGAPLSPHEERLFEDGEHKARPLASVRGRDVFVLESLYGDADRSVNDRLVRLLFFAGACRDAGAARVTAVLPYLAYARKDRRSKWQDPVATRYVAQLLEAVGIDTVATLDVHNLAAYQNAFRCRSEHLEANGLFAHHFAPRIGDEEVSVVAPDEGGLKRAEDFRQRLARTLGRPVGSAFVEKYRGGGEVSGSAFAGDVAGRVALVVDDMISAGTTVARAVAACRQNGAVRVYAAATHGVLAPEANRVLGAADVDAIAVTDSIPLRYVVDPRLRERLTVVSVVPLFAEAIRRLHAEESLSGLDDA